MNAEETYLECLHTIERIAAFVARRNHLDASEAEEFIQEVRVRLLDDDYRIIRKFEGRSSFSTYLMTVIARLFTQWRVAQWGKWRPSAEAKRLGETAIALERLISRDGFTFEEAVRFLTTPRSAGYDHATLQALYLRLPVRHQRTVIVSKDVIPDILMVEAEAHARLEGEERERVSRLAAQHIGEVIQRMAPQDQVILQMRFWDARRVPDIALALKIDQKKLYKRIEWLLARLRRELEKAGFGRQDLAV